MELTPHYSRESAYRGLAGCYGRDVASTYCVGGQSVFYGGVAFRFRERDFAASAANFRELLRRRIESFEVHYYLARALVGLRRHAEAVLHFEGAIRYQPAYGTAYEGLAECHVARGDLKTAIVALERGRKALPKDAGLAQREAALREKAGDQQGALRAYEAALTADAKSASLRIRVGEPYRDAGDLDRVSP